MGLREGLIDFGSVRAKMGADAAAIQRENAGFPSFRSPEQRRALSERGLESAVILP
jgi:hypothetical protein